MRVTEESLWAGIAAMRLGGRVTDISARRRVLRPQPAHPGAALGHPRGLHRPRHRHRDAHGSERAQLRPAPAAGPSSSEGWRSPSSRWSPSARTAGRRTTTSGRSRLPTAASRPTTSTASQTDRERAPGCSPRSTGERPGSLSSASPSAGSPSHHLIACRPRANQSCRLARTRAAASWEQVSGAGWVVILREPGVSRTCPSSTSSRCAATSPRRRPRRDAPAGAGRRRAGLPPLLGRRAPQHAGCRRDQPAGPDRDARRGDLADPGRLRRRDAAQPRPARRRRAVRAARGGAPRPDRPRHRPGARHRPGDALRAARRRRRVRTRTRSPASPSTSTTCGCCSPRTASGCSPRGPRAPAPRDAGRPRCLTSGCSARPTTRPGWPRSGVCPTSSRTTSRAGARPRRSSSTARRTGPRPEHPEPRTFLTVNAVVAASYAEEAERLALPNQQAMVALRTGADLFPQRLVEDAEAVGIAPEHSGLAAAMRSGGWSGTRLARPRRCARSPRRTVSTR
jgi:hypothetical protein